MRTLILFLSLSFAASVAAQERNYESKTTVMEFRGKFIRWEAKKNPDGTWNDVFKDIKGNLISEFERNFMIGNEKLGSLTFKSTFLTSMVGGETPSLFLATGAGSFPGFGENPEFREYTGITLEQIRNMRLAVWDLADFPPDEMVDICVRAATTEDAEELAALGEDRLSIFRELTQRSEAVILAELSPEQIQKLWELEWQMPGNSASTDGEDVFIGFERYNALDLSEEQQKRLAALKKEFIQAAPEILKLRGKEGGQKLVEFVKATREKVKGTLTDAQKAKLEQLLAEKPQFLTKPAAPPPKKEDNYEWLDRAWQPGDPLPPGAIPPPPPAGRFPRPK